LTGTHVVIRTYAGCAAGGSPRRFGFA